MSDMDKSYSFHSGSKNNGVYGSVYAERQSHEPEVHNRDTKNNNNKKKKKNGRQI